MITVATIWAPRPDDRAVRRAAQASLTDYIGMLRLQKRSVARLGHRHLVVSDAELDGFELLRRKLPPRFSKAIVAGQIAAIEAWDDADHLVLADCDVLIARVLEGAFHKAFDVGVTNRVEKTAPVNNGVIYLRAGARAQALALFRRALELTEDHWGGDQEALSRALAPVPDGHGIEMRTIGGMAMRVGFLRCALYNMTPHVNGIAGQGEPFAVHFKGARKRQMKPFAQRWLGL